jgi:hypothetical protein
MRCLVTGGAGFTLENIDKIKKHLVWNSTANLQE